MQQLLFLDLSFGFSFHKFPTTHKTQLGTSDRFCAARPTSNAYRQGILMNWQRSFVAFTLFLSACHAPVSVDGNGWRQAGGLDGDMIPFVEVSPDKAKDGATYREAIDRLCGPGRCVQVGFFLAGDSVPPSGPRGDFFRAGGWGNYKPLAVYMGGEFTKWDCERAGEEAAPPSALCDESTHEK
jgi:hypothetical protein